MKHLKIVIRTSIRIKYKQLLIDIISFPIYETLKSHKDFSLKGGTNAISVWQVNVRVKQEWIKWIKHRSHNETNLVANFCR